MLERHYAPRARLFLFPSEAAPLIAAEASALARQGEIVGALLRQATVPVAARTVVLPDDPQGYARGLYQALHELDDAGCTVIMVEEPPGESAWEAVRDRLERAARR
jgi:L-threonylcarbamoyladenylate synthase